jgi:hypothetical protein
MKKSLTKISNAELYYFKDGVKFVIDKNDKKTYPPNLSGNVSYLSGYVSGLSGNLDDFEITDEDREKGINIEYLVK